MASATFKPMPQDSTQKGKDHHPDQAFDKAKEAGKEALDKAKEGAKDAISKTGEGFDKARQSSGEALDKAKEAAQAVGQGVGQMASQAAGMASQAAGAIGDKAQDLTAAAGHGIAQAGDKLAEKLPQGGIAGKASHMVTDALHDSGRYIEEQKLSGMAKDVEAVIRNHPIPTMLVCLGIGFCLGRVFKD